jgi:hypothetical protein
MAKKSPKKIILGPKAKEKLSLDQIDTIEGNHSE